MNPHEYGQMFCFLFFFALNLTGVNRLRELYQMIHSRTKVITNNKVSIPFSLNKIY